MKIFKTLLLMTALVASSENSFGQDPDYRSLSQTIDAIYNCQLVKPMLGQTAESSTRVGAILSGIQIDRVDGKTIAHRVSGDSNYCTPTLPLPVGAPTVAPKAWSYLKGASASITAEFGKVFTLGAIKANYVEAFEFNVTDAKIYEIDTEKRYLAASDIKGRLGCGPVLKTIKAKPDFINYPVMVTHVCVGKVDVGFIFDRGIDASAIAIQIGQLKVGLSVQLQEILGSEAECAKDAKPANPKAADDSANAAGLAALKAIFDYALKTANEAAQKAKQLADQAGKAKDDKEKKDKTAAADEANKKAEDLKKKADAAEEQVKKAAAAPLKFAGKCYKSARLVSDEPVVFGFQYKPAAEYLKPQ